MSKFRKKPVVIEAMQFRYSEKALAELQEFCGLALVEYGCERRPGAKAWAQIATLEDGPSAIATVKHIATEGDWIIKGVANEFYPCKPDIFDATYEPAD